MNRMADAPILTSADGIKVAFAGWQQDPTPFNKEFQSEKGFCVPVGTYDALDFDEIESFKPDIMALQVPRDEVDPMPVIDKLLNVGAVKHFPLIVYWPQRGEDPAVRKMMERGVYHILSKFMSVSDICQVMRSTYLSHAQMSKLQADVARRTSAVGYIRSGEFEIHNLVEARNLSTMLCLACPDPKAAMLGLFELMANGIEHGVLKIGYDEKTELMLENKYELEVQRRLNTPDYTGGVVVRFYRLDDRLKFEIIDSGDGFDPTPYLTFSPDRAMDPHGRGIAMSKVCSFDSVEYIGKGNEVHCEIMLR